MAKLEYHQDADYAVIMRPKDTTDRPLARLFGQHKDVAKYGPLFAVSPELLDWAQLFEKSIVYEISKSEKEGDDEGARLKVGTLNLLRDTISRATTPPA